jgi:hypothetical protein
MRVIVNLRSVALVALDVSAIALSFLDLSQMIVEALDAALPRKLLILRRS